MVDATTTNLGLTKPTVGADSNAWGGILNTDLDQIDALWATLGNTPFGTAAGKALAFFAQAANNLSDLTNATTARTNLGLGTSATQNTGTAGAAVPLLDGANTWSAAQTLSAGLTSAGDITVYRSGATTTGFTFYGNTGTHYLGFDGTNFVFGGSGHLTAPSGGFAGDLVGNVTGSSGSCTGNAASATTAGSCSGNSATATIAATLSTGTGGPNEIVWDDTNGQWVFYVRGIAVSVVNSTGFVNLV